MKRLGPGLGVVAAIAAGLGTRHFLTGAVAKYGGVALWSTCLYAVLLTARPRLGVLRAALWTAGLSWLVELAQLTPGPAYLSSQHVVLRLIFGTTFSAWDLPAYLAGVVLAMALHGLVLRRRRDDGEDDGEDDGDSVNKRSSPMVEQADP